MNGDQLKPMGSTSISQICLVLVLMEKKLAGDSAHLLPGSATWNTISPLLTLVDRKGHRVDREPRALRGIMGDRVRARWMILMVNLRTTHHCRR